MQMGDCGSTSLGESQSGYHLRMQSPVPGSERSGTARRCCQNQSLNQIWSLKTTVVAKVDEKQLPQTRTLLTTSGDLLFVSREEADLCRGRKQEINLCRGRKQEIDLCRGRKQEITPSSKSGSVALEMKGLVTAATGDVIDMAADIVEKRKVAPLADAEAVIAGRQRGRRLLCYHLIARREENISVLWL
ncbi:hypothetical protein BHE74_00059697 [Ensete ventricosum]|nr:hypothetical protein BHE74_00059697 [Ensete ventricosum]